MGEFIRRVCPECGERVVGRSDGCRIMAANRRGRRTREEYAEILKDLIELGSKGGGKYIKFIHSVIKFCKILYKFGH